MDRRADHRVGARPNERSRVTWTKLDDNFWMHPQVLEVGNVGAGVYVRMLSYTTHVDSAGFVDSATADTIAGPDVDALAALAAAGLITRDVDGVRIVDPPRRHGGAWDRRRRRERMAQGIATAQQIAARVAYYGGLCWMCREPYAAIDHVKPLSKGGSNWPANLRPACWSCNSRKGARWPL
jgi:hypothetical protein